MNFDQILSEFKNERKRLQFELLRIERAMQAQRSQEGTRKDPEIKLPGTTGKPDEEFFLGNQHL